MSEEITVFKAKRVLTMDPGRPNAEAVAVRDGRILSVGSLASMRPWLDNQPHTIDTSFADNVIMPGFIDPHTHLRWAGSVTALHYLGPITSPTGSSAQPTREDVFTSLRALDAQLPDGEPIFAWGFDPAYQGGHLHRDELDAISARRPIWILAYAIHYLYVNSPLLDALGADDAIEVHGVGRYPDGRLDGTFVEMEAVRYAQAPFMDKMHNRDAAREGLWKLAGTAQRAGVTTTADMGLGVQDFDTELNDHLEIVNHPDFPLRMTMCSAEIAVHKAHGSEAAQFVKDLSQISTDKLHFNGVKVWLDGSYQAMSLRLNYPGYVDGGNGLRGDVPWDELAERILPYWERKVPIHAHANGDEAIDACLDLLEQLQDHTPRMDHRFTIEHYLISNTSQARRLAKLGGLASVLVQYVHHRSQVQNLSGLGPDRSEATARLGSLAREGVSFGLHSDFAFALLPISPLEAAWTAVTRLAADNETVQAPGERIPVDRALRAITIDAALVIGMEDKVGSLEIGKFADFAVLDRDPTTIPPDEIRKIDVVATVLGGKSF
ncbi:amidohydrolase [Brevibacterium zhoupengii]|uniref:amidohydrolase n=1 Tax=Brevibacterium zhoupengii TaxID=2898795 RepID=UPI001E38EA8C|nr:amidohydrolase [Brevibacterium zhoupengii]